MESKISNKSLASPTENPIDTKSLFHAKLPSALKLTDPTSAEKLLRLQIKEGWRWVSLDWGATPEAQNMLSSAYSWIWAENPYITEQIKRFGEYVLDLDRRPANLYTTRDKFLFEARNEKLEAA